MIPVTAALVLIALLFLFALLLPLIIFSTKPTLRTLFVIMSGTRARCTLAIAVLLLVLPQNLIKSIVFVPQRPNLPAQLLVLTAQFSNVRLSWKEEPIRDLQTSIMLNRGPLFQLTPLYFRINVNRSQS